jgi:tetratricopeptide (TPR) repeat protein
MNGLKKAIVGLGLVGLLSSPYLLGKANAEEVASKKQEISQLEQKANSYFGTKAPDEALYNLIDGIDDMHIGELTIEGKYDEVLPLIEKVDIIKDYDLTSLDNRRKLNFASVVGNIGSSYYSKKMYEEATRFGAMAVELDPTNQLHWRNLALDYKELGKSKKNKIFLLRSIELYKKVIEVSGKYSEEAKKIIETINTKYLPDSN